MITRIIQAIINGVRYTWNHPHILFTLVFMIILPVLFLLVADRFFDAGRANQDRLQKDRVGILQDSFVAMLQANGYDAQALESIVENIADINPDITKFRIARRFADETVPVVALNEVVEGIAEDETEFYRAAAVHDSETIIVPYQANGDRFWQAFRYAGFYEDSDWFIFTELSLANTDNALSQNERDAYMFLIPVFIIIFFLAYWQFKNTDYRYLYLKAEEAIKTRDLFASMITHELRSPLTAMRGYASLIEESDEATFENREHASRIRQSTERLLSIVNDLLEVARIQSGRLKVDFERVNLSEVIQNAIFELKPSANAKSITLAHSGTDKPVYVMTDNTRLHQVLVNLLSNAIKYTEEGRIEVEMKKERKGVEIRVKDTGMGIKAEDQQKLFAPFFRVENESVDKITGTGLGMWITKQIIDILGGTVGVESIRGVGTNVVMHFPERPPKVKRDESAGEPRKQNKTS